MTHFKNLTTLLLFLIIMASQSCSDEMPEPISSEKSVPIQSDYISIDEAISMAINASSLLASDTETRTFNLRAVDTTSPYVALTTDGTRSNNDTTLYVVNYANNQGYAIISHRRIEKPILAVTAQGNITTTDSIINNGIKFFLETAESYAVNAPIASASPAFEPPIEAEQWEYKTETTNSERAVEPRIKVQWGQTGLYGKFCTNSITGCANTACAQAMTYFQYPTSLNLTHKSNANLTLNWNALINHKSGWSTSLTCCASSTHGTIALLMRELGQRAKSIYKTSSTSTFTKDVRTAMEGIGFNVGQLNNYYKSFIMNNLGDNCIIYVRGTNDKDEGHGWIADGYKATITTVTTLRKKKYHLMWEEVSVVRSELVYNHYNWGWNGSSDGYFLDDTFNGFSKDVQYFTIKR